MADLGPNLKICIENTEEESGSESSGASGSKSSANSDSGSESSTGSESESDTDVESRSDEIDAPGEKKTESVATHRVVGPAPLKPRARVNRKYENKAGDFVTGFDPMSEEYRAKKKERAKRFGFEAPESSRDLPDIKILYRSLGVTEEDALGDDRERDIRLNAIHLRGVDEMNTKDVLTYFQEFAPGNIEWIDDSSCNVVWQEEVTAARAMLAKSYSRREAETRAKQESDDCRADKQPSSLDDGGSKEGEVAVRDEVAVGDEVPVRVEEAMEDDDALNLMSSDEEEDMKASLTQPTSQATEAVVAKADVDADTSSSSSGVAGRVSIKYSGADCVTDNPEASATMDVFGVADSLKENKQPPSETSIPWPPGRWRLAASHSNTKCIFLRFATRADQKLGGTEGRSNYYGKRGRPNWGGVKGVISGSRKRRLRGAHEEGGGREARWAGLGNQVDASDMDWDALLNMHVQASDFKQKNLPSYRKHGQHIQSDENDSADLNESDSEGDAAEVRLVISPHKGREMRADLRARLGKALAEDEEFNLEETELDRLLAPPPAKRTMRMYADEEEERSSLRSSEKLSYRSESARDARSRIGTPHLTRSSRSQREPRGSSSGGGKPSSLAPGGDLRNRLNRKREGGEGGFTGKVLPRVRVSHT